MPAVGPDAVLADSRVRTRAGLLSLVVSIVLLAAKYQAYRMTGSTAILSDALESIVNVVAAVFALGGIAFAAQPADRNHPYGHGKIEFFSAAFEGGLIAFAAVLIIYQVLQAFLYGVEIRALDAGLAIVVLAGLANLALGLYLLRVGSAYQSLTLVADGKHVLSDFWTSVGIVVGLLLVRATGLWWLDPVTAAGLDRTILEVRRRTATTMVVVTHDLPSAFTISDRIVVLIDGRIRAIGAPKEIEACDDPAVVEFVRRRAVAAASEGGEAIIARQFD